jgi:hypothetical protein
MLDWCYVCENFIVRFKNVVVPFHAWTADRGNVLNITEEEALDVGRPRQPGIVIIKNEIRRSSIIYQITNYHIM